MIKHSFYIFIFIYLVSFYIFNQKKMLMLGVKIQMGGFKIYLGLRLAPMEGRKRDADTTSALVL